MRLPCLTTQILCVYIYICIICSKKKLYRCFLHPNLYREHQPESCHGTMLEQAKSCSSPCGCMETLQAHYSRQRMARLKLKEYLQVPRSSMHFDVVMDNSWKNHNWLVVWNIFIFPSIGNNHPNWLIFFRGVQTTNQWKNHKILLLRMLISHYHALLYQNSRRYSRGASRMISIIVHFKNWIIETTRWTTTLSMYIH